ncbi:hypothetical protein NBRGN_066_00600 [Nocardia brasiliensis NBRC 14402]|uniref:FAD-dependent oxidoreductase n=1 Tax=Nocardia brasiliensis TaxID=37326 RepID=UPI000304EF9C|nr:NAD(P)-binding protein [Nocardia brasiliensis]ASF08189.1 monooxygenase [Nocardia brasiliensis]GAJ83835.1 hypothetical protein NBRGN_066_00600 [Nocardia brasiliensis NBRC 14402]SUB54132.1 Uncharacterized conserved protein [Nocardia brasiliensis]
MEQPVFGGDRVLVLGAGIAGLLAAHVLGEHGAHVTIIEPDALPAGPAARRGTPQARHPHGLLHRGAAVLESLFPGFSDELVRHGARTFDFGEGARVRFPHGQPPPITTGVRHHALSRALLEHVVRTRVLDRDAITLDEGVRAQNLLWHKGKVTGILDGHGTRRPADLVVDATGRASKLTDWLTEAGLAVPAPQQVCAQLSYTSRLFECDTDDRPAWRLSAELTYAPATRRGGVATCIENDRILLTLIGADGERAPRDEPGFRAYAESLHSPHFFEIATGAKPLSGITCYSGLNNRWRRYHRMPRWPDGLIALGDAVCTLNPIYGHGMTVAALQAGILRRVLAAGPPRCGFARTVQRAIPAAIRVPWQLAAYSDIGWQTTHHWTPPYLAHRIVRRLVDRMPDDPGLYRRFIAVQNLLAHPATLAVERSAGQRTHRRGPRR